MTGGNFWQGAATGFIVSALNHAAHNETQAGGDPPDEGCVICPDYNLDGRSSWWEWTIDGALYAGDFLLGGPTGESLLAKSALMGIFKGAGVKAGGNLLGKSFGRLGTVVKNPNIRVKMLDEGGHYLTSKINRAVPSSDIISTLKNPSVVLKQANGRFLYLSNKAGVVINQSGKLITTYGARNFDSNTLNVLKAVGH